MPGGKKRLKNLWKWSEHVVDRLISIEDRVEALDNEIRQLGVDRTNLMGRVESLDDAQNNYVPNPAYIQSLEKRIEKLEREDDRVIALDRWRRESDDE